MAHIDDFTTSPLALSGNGIMRYPKERQARSINTPFNWLCDKIPMVGVLTAYPICMGPVLLDINRLAWLIR